MTNESRRVYRDKTTELICVKRKIQKNSEQHSAIVAGSLRSWTLAMLYEPMVNFSAKLYCLAADKIAAQFSLPVCLWQVGALRKRWEIGLWLLWGVDRKSPPGYSETPSSTPRPPFSPNCGSRPLVKTDIANCGQTAPDTTVVCVDSIWEQITAYPTISFRRLGASPKSMQSIGCVVRFPYLLVYKHSTFI